MKVKSRTDIAAEKWLARQGYRVKYNWSGSPDFIADSGEKFEVKTLIKNTVAFTEKQILELSYNSDTKVLVFEPKGKDPVYVATVDEILKIIDGEKQPPTVATKRGIKKIKVRVYSTSVLKIPVDAKTKRKLKKLIEIYASKFNRSPRLDEFFKFMMSATEAHLGVTRITDKGTLHV